MCSGDWHCLAGVRNIFKVILIWLLEKCGHKVDDNRWEIRRGYREGMQVPGMIYASEKMLDKIWEDKAFEQVINVSFLPGIVGNSLAMPDIHWGYGFPIGGVAATRVKDGVISPGGVGFVSTACTPSAHQLKLEEIKPDSEIVQHYFTIFPPSGLEGKLKVSEKDLKKLAERAAWESKRFR
jgi:tRNA-splicing ligase RtcB